MSDRFTDWTEPGSTEQVTPRQCSQCRHLRNRTLWTCDAFPNGIPAPILTNRFDHRNLYPGDHGVRFEPLPDAAETGDESSE